MATVLAPPVAASQTTRILTLTARPAADVPPSRRVVWRDDALDNEGMGKRKSKCWLIRTTPIVLRASRVVRAP